MWHRTRLGIEVLLLLIAVLPASTQAAEQQARIGVVYAETPSTLSPAIAAFWRRLAELGWIEGRNLTIEARWAEGNVQRLPVLMSEVLDRKIDVLVTWTTPAALAAKAATAGTRTPVVVGAMADPVGTGIVANLAHPEGNVTGFSLGHDQAFASKWLELMIDMVPRLTAVGLMFNPDNPAVTRQAETIRTVAKNAGMQVHALEIRRSNDFDEAFANARRQGWALMVLADALTMQYRREIVALAAKSKIPAVYSLREYVDAGGLMSYGASNIALSRRAAEYVDRILKGAKAGDLPVEQPTEFNLVVNLKTAKSLGLNVPESILLRANEVIR